jgi:membrane fusion protein (multidrug efflux system)
MYNIKKDLMQKILFSKRAKIISGIIVLIFAFLCVSRFFGADEKLVEKQYVPVVQTTIVAPGLNREIGVTGEVQADKSAELSADFKADVAQVLVKNGDTVQAGQVLLRLKSPEISSNLATTQAAYNTARSSVTQTDLSSQKSIEAARVALTTTENNLANTLKQNAAARRQAEEALNAAVLNLGLSTDSAQTALDSTIQSIDPVVRSALDTCDQFVGVSETYKYSNDSYENYLGVRVIGSKEAAEFAVINALALLSSGASDYTSALNLLLQVEVAVQKTLVMLNNSTSSTYFSQTDLNAAISSITGQLSAVRGAIASLKSVKANLESVAQSTEGGSQTTNSAQALYDATLAQLTSAEDSARNAVESAKAGLENSMRSAELSKLGARSSLTSVQGSLSQAAISQDKLVIRAPFAGKVVDIPVKVGDEVSPGETMVIVENAAILRLVTYLSSEEVRKIHVGDKVKIASKSEDQVASIAPSADPLTKKYKVEILHQNPHLHPGEFVRLRFQVANGEVENRIFLPITAIEVLPQESFVWQVVEGKTKKAPVILGEIEGGFVEVISGVSLGDEIITTGGRILEEEGITVEVSNAQK